MQMFVFRSVSAAELSKHPCSVKKKELETSQGYLYKSQSLQVKMLFMDQPYTQINHNIMTSQYCLVRPSATTYTINCDAHHVLTLFHHKHYSLQEHIC